MNLLDRVRTVGVLGAAKTVYYSTRHASSPLSLVFHSNVLVDIDPDTTFDIDGSITFGILGTPASHPRLARSKFSTAPGSTISHTGNWDAEIGPGSVVHVEGDFSMGDSTINCHSRILCSNRVTIGDGATISWNFELIDDDRHQIVIDGERPDTGAPVEIEDDVWIGHDVSVGKGVTIGEGSVIASDSVVTSDVPPNTLAGGCPAEVLRENVDWE